MVVHVVQGVHAGFWCYYGVVIVGICCLTCRDECCTRQWLRVRSALGAKSERVNQQRHGVLAYCVVTTG
jgi:hypothetical protein